MEKDHVRANTSYSSNQAIDNKIISTLQSFSTASSDKISQRIDKIEKEYNVERVLELNASILAFIGVLLGAFVNAYWLILPGLVLPFLALHAVQGWCPPLPILRALKVRTQREIDSEKYSLKILRGDFDNLQNEKDIQKILQVVRK
ncbi:hypothetical protein [Legionella jamestowniensis]|uniref:DUF2892 domain-containing protein n=1 Tax=Legionella jamestowniensis TaxID=455 RepID=A0A0W0ULM5_9GAMM|nr:hypothetical protein [Legionella jamestowniensis]KTD08534.1 hypothetical protein Ljam_2729 [Legionella jamestowniensis]SFL52508.1 hypothetical protein SAMN02746073_0672 [Legionella jamestowniensis DSM 19215]